MTRGHPARLALQGQHRQEWGETVQDTEALVSEEMRGSVLLVEDVPANQEVARAMLAALGIRSTTADNGRMAIEFIRVRDFDLVLMDCQMPVMDGLEATAAIRALPNHRGKMPIVALTDNAMHGDERKCLDAGMDGFLAKPLMLAQLEATLCRWLPHKNSGHGSTDVTPSIEELREAPAEDPEIINLGHLATLRHIGAKTGRDLVADLLRRFLATADERTVPASRSSKPSTATTLCGSSGRTVAIWSCWMSTCRV